MAREAAVSGFSRDARTALRITWVITGVAALLAALLPFVADAQFFALIPACPARLSGSPCALCGMTTAWLHLAAGDWSGALAAHRYGPLLWAICALNGLAASVFALRKGVLRCSC